MKFNLFFLSTVLLGANATHTVRGLKSNNGNKGKDKRNKGGNKGNKGNKIDVCHLDKDSGTWNTISVSTNRKNRKNRKNHGDFVCGENSLECNSSLGCVCVDGYEFKGEYGCVDINECTDSPCGDFSTCMNTEGSFTCTCDDGFVGDGMLCVPVGVPVCHEVNGLNWCYNDQDCGQPCKEVCASFGAKTESNLVAWFEAQNTEEGCSAIADAFGVGYDISDYAYACVESGYGTYSIGAGLVHFYVLLIIDVREDF